MSDLKGKNILVTGAGGALALGVLPALRAAGATLALADLSAPTARVEGSDVALAADLTTSAGADAAWSSATAALGELHGVAHLVGGFTWGPAHEATDADVDRMIALNLRTTVNVVRAALPSLRARGTGWIAGIASGQAYHRGAADVALYAATKAAAAAYLRSVDAELAGTNVAVTVLYPMGVIDTAANRSDMPDADPATWIDPAALGEALAFAASRSARGRVLDLPVYPRR